MKIKTIHLLAYRFANAIDKHENLTCFGSNNSTGEFRIFGNMGKMKQSEIKNNFHRLIGETDNERLLMKFYDFL